MPLGSLAGGIASLFGVGDPKVKPRDLEKEILGMLRTQPYLFGAQAAFSDPYAQLNLLNQERALFGSDAVGGSVDWSTQTGGPVTIPKGQKAPSGYVKLGTNPDGSVRYSPPSLLVPRVSGGPQGGLFGLYDRANTRATQQYLDTTRRQREGEMSLLGELAPRLRASRDASDPNYYGGLNELMAGARADYGAGGDINPSDRRWLSQQAAGEWSSRGLGGSPAAALDALSKSFGFSENLRNSRQNRLTGALGAYNAGAGTPYDLLFGRPSGQMTAPMLNSAASLQGGASASANPMSISGYAGQLYDYNANADAFNRITEANNRIAGITSVGKGVSSLAGMGFGGMGGGGGLMGGGVAGGGTGSGAVSGITPGGWRFAGM